MPFTKAQSKWVSRCRYHAKFRVTVKRTEVILHGTGRNSYKKRDRHPATPPGITFVAKGETMFGEPWRSFSRTPVPNLADIIKHLDAKAEKLSREARSNHAAEVNLLISTLQREDFPYMKKAVNAALARKPDEGEYREDLDRFFQWVSDALDAGREMGLL